MSYVIYRRKPNSPASILVRTLKPMSENEAISTAQGLNKLEQKKKASFRNVYGYVHQNNLSSLLAKLQAATT